MRLPSPLLQGSSSTKMASYIDVLVTTYIPSPVDLKVQSQTKVCLATSAWVDGLHARWFEKNLSAHDMISFEYLSELTEVMW